MQPAAPAAGGGPPRRAYARAASSTLCMAPACSAGERTHAARQAAHAARRSAGTDRASQRPAAIAAAAPQQHALANLPPGPFASGAGHTGTLTSDWWPWGRGVSVHRISGTYADPVRTAGGANISSVTRVTHTVHIHR